MSKTYQQFLFMNQLLKNKFFGKLISALLFPLELLIQICAHIATLVIMLSAPIVGMDWQRAGLLLLLYLVVSPLAILNYYKDKMAAIEGD